MNQNNAYERTVRQEILAWRQKILRKPNSLSQSMAHMQARVYSHIPKNVQDFMTKSIKTMTQTILAASGMIQKTDNYSKLSLSERDYLLEKKYQTYNKVAIAQGVSFGLGGMLMGLGDFPALLSIKVKFLFDCASIYGFDINDPKERRFMLYVFQLAFCSDTRRPEVFSIIKNWDFDSIPEIDWEKFQVEYRDTIDIAKMLQLLPVVGSVFGGTANHRLLKHLKITAMNSYRLRIIRRDNLK
ncbi:hypothetical protein AOC36_07415 [Erysipelothrix larvae]|uniref:ABC transporter-associated protein EcsC n=1 Tax=Erysipelothrix larvae TaxID=1514105 RepID=A0A0X8H0I5_9FIRM|nr:EcsC family protein [Erysipelothrix larvae]AMC93817.1 hypothetical protein AOC36_07415 [Erysipelothrix larvae]